MNVGILSMQRVKNWGSFLQAYALKRTVEELGHTCSFLDIKPCVGLNKNELIELNKKNSVKTLLDKFFLVSCCILKGQLLARVKGRAFQKEFASKYNNVFLPMLGINPNKYEDDKIFDIVVIGSDEVFNCTQNSPWCRTLHLFGEGIKAKKIVTYAASFGYTDLNALEKYGLKSRVKEALKNISSISVRDQNSYTTIEQLTGKSPELSVDPVMIFDFASYMPSTVPEEDYLVVYSYPGRISDSATVRAIKGYAKLKNKKIISLLSYYGWADKSIIPETPLELLAYFENADYVVTDTFHGTIFSMKYNRNFCTIVRDSNRQKLGFLLSQNELSHRVVKDASDIKYVFDQEIDYNKTNSIIEAETKRAKVYLQTVLRL